MYLLQVLDQYAPRNLLNYSYQINQLENRLKTWASGCYIATHQSGSRAKGTAISIASDVDYMISLTNNCNENNGGLESIYNSLHFELSKFYPGAKKQNVSVRIELPGNVDGNLEVDVTPARRWSGNTRDHSLWVSKKNTWKKTNINTHINDISKSGRLNEIKLLKIWREVNKLDFPSIYMEYLLIQILYNRSIKTKDLAENFWFILTQLAKNDGNPLLIPLKDPANSTNILSDLLSKDEKHKIYTTAIKTIDKKNWNEVIW